ncbi:uroporphyrinogen-III C-methyltransferase [Vibrio spartinae]|uniref:Uroporphyrinogen-III C-methyltransferase n=1 Tax=Vibrio spartinae TaxID=1918945 RepID=A0A1N6M9W7_9VIBR|nr:uroporphyrinogen-III C-methyltransferase [Vibrio spartinae]QMV15904.1 Putative uroporphyrinogen-III C-methyltransferase [Vibrio spartinae]SIO96258.1 Putative uroporphyrinogen-III C-methyltransferase [Vibrio spartinae]
MTDTKKAVTPTSEDKQKSATSSSASASKPEATAPSGAKSKQKTPASGARLSKIAIVLTLLSGGGIAAYVQYTMHGYQQQITQLQQQLSQSVSQVETQVTQLNQDVDKKTATVINQVDTHLDQQQKSIDSLQHALADMKGRRPNDWLLAESDYLVKLAGRKLFLEHDVLTATHLMESADARIAALNDPSLVSLRQAMANDITTLKSLPLIDKDGLVLRLTSLEQLIDKLPLANAILPDAPQEQKPQVSEDISHWQDNLLTSMKSFAEQFITFRTRDGNVIPLLSPEQDFYLRENLKAKIETAIRAIYDENQEIYTTALTTANQWSISFLNPDNAQVKQFNQATQSLSQKKITIQYPIKLASQQPLTDLIHERLRKQVSGLMKEEE